MAGERKVVSRLIDKIYGKFRLMCDSCGETLEETFDTWDEAVSAKKDNDWDSLKNRDGSWHDLCSDCK